ncbi:MAG: histidine--tRNA ligase [Rhodospirillaceae bacterium]|jgi:histidyl-tRNA synthetase|nr:histidine--tRNA ligase [Rhodospirillaceae bacterium]MBT4045198.1 histidine--tRNA ligase [Rhodospirillaceae bacterium]MBT4687313.1 histidine--tRNA ligase [Rhodospirillaceae bacterium]MBT5083914.1 histidine--tRNA ligase [Rhodospirillaceae bacterium]MBT5526674.1 histidine--tRNA ligase [Rhodospirillaceae bacterium]
MAKIQSVRGTHDIVGETAAQHHHVVDVARNCAQRYGFGDIDTPIFEFTPVFARTMGEGSDVVRKEMYSFTDRGGEDITLRPEFTAGICRAFISGGMQQDLPLKFFAHGPAFRYERPQKGRLRQFHQIDAEILGVEGPGADIEIITLGAEILHDLGVLDRCVLELNTLGDPESRQTYRDALVAYFSDHRDKLSEDSVDRLARNPLRILDSKDEGDQKIVVDAPLMTAYLNQQSQDFFAAVCEGLDVLGIAYNLNQRLVRGLDYYTHTAFEFVTDALGSQGAVIAGGRYDGLIKMLGGPQTPGIGWAGGIERLGMLADHTPEPTRPIAFVPLGEVAERMALGLTHALRRDGHVVDMAFRGNLNRRMKRANKINASLALILGEDEIAKGMITVRDLDEGGQQDVDLDAIGLHLRKLIS